MARCGCGDSSASSVRSVLSASNGVQYDSSSGHFSALISGLPGNNLSLDGSGALFVPTGAATVTTGAGILGNGSGGNPVRANVAAWPFPTAVGTNAQGVYVNGSGQLISPPAQKFDYVLTAFARNYGNLAVNTGSTPVAADTFTVTLTNPDPNRACLVLIWRDVDMRFTLPGTSGGGPSTAACTVDGDSVFKIGNTGSATQSNMGITTSMSFKSTNLAAGASGSYVLTVGTQDGTGGATYSRIEANVRVLYLSI